MKKNLTLLLTLCTVLFSVWAFAKATHPLTPTSQIVTLQNAQHRQTPSKKADVRILARGENAFMGLLEMQAGAKVPLHRDATEEYIHILQGSGDITINGKTTKIQKGDTVYMPANAEVTFQNSDKPLKGLQVFAGPQPADKYLKWPMAAK